MKKLIILFILCSITLIAMAQDDTAEQPTKEWALNVAFLSGNLLRSGNISPNATPNVIAYKAIWENGNAFRLGFGGAVNSDSEQGLFHESTMNIHFHMGYEKQKQLSRRWITFMGFEVPFNLNKENRAAWDVGAGALWGIQWMIHPNVGIYTEGGFYYSRSVDPSDFVPIVNKVEFIIPRALYLGVRF